MFSTAPTKEMLLGVAAEICLLCFFVYFPYLQPILGSASLPAEYWGLAMIPGLAVAVSVEVRKWFARSHPGGFADKWLSW